MCSTQRFIAALVAGGLALGTLVGCGGSGDDSDSSLTVQVTSNYWDTPLRHAIAEGWFEEVGLDVEAVPYAPDSAVTSVVSGESDIGVTGLGTVIGQSANSLPIRALAGQLVEGKTPDTQMTGLVAAQGSGIESFTDLAGKTVGVLELKGPSSGQLLARVKDAGAETDSIKFVATPGPGMVEALNRGDIDAAVAPVPFMNQAVKAGATRIGQVSTPGTPVPVYFVTQKFANSHRDEIDKFLRILNRAYAWANDNRDAVVANFAKAADVPIKAAEAMPKALWVAKFDATAIEQNIADMKAAGYLENDVTANDVVLSDSDLN